MFRSTVVGAFRYKSVLCIPVQYFEIIVIFPLYVNAEEISINKDCDDASFYLLKSAFLTCKHCTVSELDDTA